MGPADYGQHIFLLRGVQIACGDDDEVIMGNAEIVLRVLNMGVK